ncbi:hypothetical protein F5Y16DRAFT_398683 [Xylariaceae sp. FL0255]|nr:hypothetical protein F5Y16DRAFT_398683 [Xylariaceae sp. FL0255]
MAPKNTSKEGKGYVEVKSTNTKTDADILAKRRENKIKRITHRTGASDEDKQRALRISLGKNKYSWMAKASTCYLMPETVAETLGAQRAIEIGVKSGKLAKELQVGDHRPNFNKLSTNVKPSITSFDAKDLRKNGINMTATDMERMLVDCGTPEEELQAFRKKNGLITAPTKQNPLTPPVTAPQLTLAADQSDSRKRKREEYSLSPEESQQLEEDLMAAMTEEDSMSSELSSEDSQLEADLIAAMMEDDETEVGEPKTLHNPTLTAEPSVTITCRADDDDDVIITAVLPRQQVTKDTEEFHAVSLSEERGKRRRLDTSSKR